MRWIVRNKVNVIKFKRKVCSRLTQKCNTRVTDFSLYTKEMEIIDYSKPFQECFHKDKQRRIWLKRLQPNLLFLRYYIAKDVYMLRKIGVWWKQKSSESCFFKKKIIVEDMFSFISLKHTSPSFLELSEAGLEVFCTGVFSCNNLDAPITWTDWRHFIFHAHFDFEEELGITWCQVQWQWWMKMHHSINKLAFASHATQQQHSVFYPIS